MQINSFRKANLYLLALAIILISSCTSVKNFQKDKPFVYNNKIVIKSDIKPDEKKRLLLDLNNYWDDSIQIRKKSSIGFFGDYLIYFKTIDPPAVYDTNNLIRSIRFMDNYLKTQGYYHAIFTYDTINKFVHHQHRVTPVVTIDLGKNITIDSVGFNLSDSGLQKLAIQNTNSTLLKLGNPYTKQVISNELDRLTALYKRNGYYKFSRDDIYALVDTTDSKFLDLTTDPFELAKLLDDYAKSKKENPKWKITIKQRKDTSGISSKQFYIGQVYYYPQAGEFDLTDSTINKPWLHDHVFGNYHIRFDNEIIKINPLKHFTFLKSGDPYNQTDYYNTVNALNKLGPWKQLDAKFVLRGNDSLDLHISMVPDKKYGMENTAEVSKNTGDLTAGSLLGLSYSLTFKNRNVWKQAVQSSTSFRVGLELNPDNTDKTLQTVFSTLTHTYSFPKMIGEKTFRKFVRIIPTKFLRNNINSVINTNDKRTLLSINGSYSDRFNLFRLRSAIGSFGYEFKRDDKVWIYKPVNVELYGLDKLAGLDSLIKQNPFLALSFNQGNVIGQSFSFSRNSISSKNHNRSHLLKIGVEESGLYTILIKDLEDRVYRYGKIQVEFIESNKYRKSEFAYKLFGGFGFNYSKSTKIGDVLPFFKQFFAGGPNSMRAWGLRQLGQGSSLLYDTSHSSFRDRFGDIRLEANFEYRFQLYGGSFLKIGSALFTDIGNVWNYKTNVANPNSEFSLPNIIKDIAVDVGTGLRFDFGGYFLLRVDVAYKVKDPGREYNGGWVNLKSASLSEKRPNGVDVNNAAIQLGIGLPF